MTYNAGAIPSPTRPKRPVVETWFRRGNTRNTPAGNVGGSRLPAQAKNVEPSTETYRVSLIANPTRHQQKAFNAYRKKVSRSGWSLIPTDPATSEKVAYIAAPYGSAFEVAAAEALVNSTVAEIIRGIAV